MSLGCHWTDAILPSRHCASLSWHFLLCRAHTEPPSIPTGVRKILGIIPVATLLRKHYHILPRQRCWDPCPEFFSRFEPHTPDPASGWKWSPVNSGILYIPEVLKTLGPYLSLKALKSKKAKFFYISLSYIEVSKWKALPSVFTLKGFNSNVWTKRFYADLRTQEK